MNEITIPADAGQLPGDVADEPPAPSGVTGIMPDAIATPEPLPSVAGLSARQMEDALVERHAAMTAAVRTWQQSGGGYPGHAAEHGQDATDPDYIARLASAESSALRAADDLRRHCQAIIAATERSPATLPGDLQAQAAARFPLVQAQVTTLPLGEIAHRVKAAIVADDAVALALFTDLLPSRLASASDSASMAERDGSKEIHSLLTTVRGNLRERFADQATLALNKRATELLMAAASARRKAGERGLKQRSLERLGYAGERLGFGKALKPVRDAKGQPVFDAEGNPVMEPYDGTKPAFDQAEVERFYRSRGTLVNR